MKKYHTFNLLLGQGENGDEWEFDRIGTEREKMQVERELQDLRERLAQVEQWKQRREEIEKELAQVWTESDAVPLNPPPYAEEEQSTSAESGELVEKAPTVSTESAEFVEKNED